MWPRINVFEDLDYREFLRDFCQQKKATEYGSSHRAFSRRAGLRSTNSLKLVMEGERNLTAEMARQFATACRLSDREADYFCELVAFNPAKDARSRARCHERMQRFRDDWVLENTDGLGRATSVRDLLGRMNRAFHDDDPAFERPADTAAENGSLLELAGFSDPSLLEPWLSFDWSQTRVSVEGPSDTARRAVSSWNACVPSRASVVSGEYGHVHGAGHDGTWLREGTSNWIETLREGGYHTANIGKMHTAPIRLPCGFERRFVADNKNHEQERQGGPDDYDVFVVKSRAHFRRGFDETGYAESIFIIEAPEPYVGTVALDALDYRFALIDKLYPFGMPDDRR